MIKVLMKKQNQKKALTLIELVVAVIILSILLIVGVGRYKIAIEKNLVREARSNLRLVRTAQGIFLEKHGVYYPAFPPYSALTGPINTDLGLNLTAGSRGLMEYRCEVHPTMHKTYRCRAYRLPSKGAFWMNSLWYINDMYDDDDSFICMDYNGVCP